MSRGNVVAGHAALLAVQVFFGLFPIFGTLAFAAGGLTPLGVGSWRIASGAVALGTIAFATHGRDALLRRADLPRFLACGLLGVALNQGLFLEGLARSTPLNAGLVMTLIPVFTFAVAVLVRQEHFRASHGLGVLIALIGAVALLLGRGGGVLGGHGFGNLLMVLNGLSYAIFLVVSKHLLSRYHSLVVIGWVYVLALPYLPYFMVGEKLIPDAGATGVWWSLLYIVLFPTILAYLLNTFALARVRVTTTAVYIYLQPMVAGVASWLVFEEEPTLRLVAAALCLFAGIWLVARRPASGPAVSRAETGPARSGGP